MAFVESLPAFIFVILILCSVLAGYWAVTVGITHRVSRWDVVAAAVAAAAWVLLNATQAAPVLALLLLGAAFNMGCGLASLSNQSRSS